MRLRETPRVREHLLVDGGRDPQVPNTQTSTHLTPETMHPNTPNTLTFLDGACFQARALQCHRHGYIPSCSQGSGLFEASGFVLWVFRLKASTRHTGRGHQRQLHSLEFLRTGPKEISNVFPSLHSSNVRNENKTSVAIVLVEDLCCQTDRTVSRIMFSHVFPASFLVASEPSGASISKHEDC